MPPLVLVACAWLAGLVAAHHWLAPAGLHPLSLVLLSLIPLVLHLLWRRDARRHLITACSAALILGALRYVIAVPDLGDPSTIAYYNGTGWLTIKGAVSSYPDVRDTVTQLRLEVESVRVGEQEQPVSGTVLVTVQRFPEYGYGDLLLVHGLLETPPEFASFSYRNYLARKGIYSQMRMPRVTRIGSDRGCLVSAAIYGVKDRAGDFIARSTPDPEASLLQGILLGIRSGIPDNLLDAYQATGTSHIIVISGANVAIVVALVHQTLGRLVGKRRAFWFTVAGIAVYVLLVGADAVVVRAALMGILYITARHLGRQATAYVSLFASALLLTVVRPLSLWELGFQLSFAATLGLALFTTPIERLADLALSRFVQAGRVQSLVRILSDVLIMTFAAQILTIPLIAYTMGRVSLVALLANLLILPVQPAVMSLGGVAMLVGLVPFLEPLARLVGLVPWLCLAYTDAVVRAMARLPLASVQTGPIAAGWVILYYTAVLAAVWALRRRREFRLGADKAKPGRQSTRVARMAIAVIVILGLQILPDLPDGRLHVAFLDVGQGDAILITTPRGQQILVDGGPSPVSLTSALGGEMPFWDRSLDLVVLTHPDADHLAGLAEVLERFSVAGWLDNGRGSDGPIFLECEALLEQKGVPRHVANAGTRLDLGRGVVLDILHPQPGLPSPGSSSNNESIVLRLEWGAVSFLMTGDIEAEAEKQLLDAGQPLRANVLKVAHHGAAASSSEAFLSAVAPSVAVISVGADNLAGHPRQEVLDRLNHLGGTVLVRTDEQGTAEFTTDGQHLWVRTERQKVVGER